MGGGGGPEFGFHGEYRELVPNERIVSTEVYEGAPDAEAVNTLTLTEHDGRTTMTGLDPAPEPGQPRRGTRSGHGKLGMNAALDKLEELARSLG